jgi:hypothetical protein
MPKTSFNSFRQRFLSGDENSITKSSRHFDIIPYFIISSSPNIFFGFVRSIYYILESITSKITIKPKTFIPLSPFSSDIHQLQYRWWSIYKTFSFFLFKRASHSFSYFLSPILSPFCPSRFKIPANSISFQA